MSDNPSRLRHFFFHRAMGQILLAVLPIPLGVALWQGEFNDLVALTAVVLFALWAYARIEMSVTTSYCEWRKVEPPSGFWGHLRSWLWRTFVLMPLALIGLVAVIWLIADTAPVGGALVLLLLAMALLGKLPWQWAGLVRHVLRPHAIGLALVTALVVALNVVGGAENPALVTSIEYAILTVHAQLPDWLVLEFVELAVLLVGLAVIAWGLPQFDAFTRHAKALHALWMGVPIIAVMASVTFFSERALISQPAEEIHQRLSVAWRESLADEERLLSEALALRVVEDSLDGTGEEVLARHVVAIAAVGGVAALAMDARLRMARAAGRDAVLADIDQSVAREWGDAPAVRRNDAGRIEPVAVVQRSPRAAMAARLTSQAQAGAIHAQTRASLASRLSDMDKDQRQLAMAWLQGVAAEQSRAYRDSATLLAGKHGDGRFTAVADSLSAGPDNGAQAMRTRLAGASDAQARTTQLLQHLAVDRPLQLADRASALLAGKPDEIDSKTLKQAKQLMDQSESLLRQYAAALDDLAPDAAAGAAAAAAITASRQRLNNARTTLAAARSQLDARRARQAAKVLRTIF